MSEQVFVYRVCECDAVAARTLDEAIGWYKEQTGLSDDELYAYDDIEVLSPDYKVHNEEDGGMITLAEIIKESWQGEPFIACSTDW